jgi:drug/metabolite transporter (DMT)-like permease
VIRKLATHVAVLYGLAILTIFLGMYYAFGQDIPRQIANIVLLGTAVTICLGWFPAAQKALRNGVQEGRELIIVTIWMSWTGLLVQRVYTIANESLGRPDWLTNSPGSIIVAVLIMVSGLYAVVAPITDPEVLSREKVWDRWAIAAGAFVSVCAAIAYYVVG